MGAHAVSAERTPGSSKGRPPRAESEALPSFMEEIAAAIPDGLAALRPEDIRVEAEFADLVVTTEAPAAAPAAAEAVPEPAAPSPEVRPEAWPSSAGSTSAEGPAAVEAPGEVPAGPLVVEPAIVAPLTAINIESPSILQRQRETHTVHEVILQPATVLAWSLLVLLALPMAFLAGLLLGHFVWK